MPKAQDHKRRQTRRTEEVLRGQTARLLSLLAASFILALALSATAAADVSVCSAGSGAGQCERPQGLAVDRESGRLYVADQHNNRIDVFGPSGAFEMAFGWGVADGEAELQRCGPAAVPATSKCRQGLEGGGAGEFSELGDVAVDNDPASPSHHDVYVLDGPRVQKFDPAGNFLLTWGGGVISGGASGSGNLTIGSTQVTNVQTTSKAFELGQTITGAGIPAATRIVSLGAGTIGLSKAAGASGTAVALSVAAGVGDVPENQVDILVNKGDTNASPNFLIHTPNPSPSSFELGQLPNNTNGKELQEALEALPNVGKGNVEVTGEKVSGVVHEYTVEFKGARLSDTNVLVQPALSTGIREVITVNNGGGGSEVCTAAIAASCSGGVEGSGQGQFGAGSTLSVGPGGTVYLAGCGLLQISASDNKCESRLQKFGPSGAFVEELELQSAPNGLALDSAGNFYVSGGNAIREYDPSGTPIGPVRPGHGVGAIATDAADNLLVAEESESTVGQRPVIAEYDSAGNTLRRFGYGVIKYANGLAPYQSPSGDLYSAEEDGVFHRSFPAPGPIVVPGPCKTKSLGNVKATLSAEVNPEGKATTVHFEYVDRESFEKEGGFASKNTKETAESESIGSDFILHEALGEASLVPETEYRCRVIATNADAPGGVTGEAGSFTSLAPLEIGVTSVSGVQAEEATLNATVNPLGIQTGGYFEYVEDALFQKDIEELGPGHGFDHAAKAPDPADEDVIEFGAANGFHTGAVTVTGLKPGTAYRYRIIATNLFFKEKGQAGLVGPTKAFRTYRRGVGALPDERAWELVSPGMKNSAEVAVPGNAAGAIEDRFIRIQAGSGSGERVTYTSWTSFGAAAAAPATNQYLSKRTEGGWATENISPFGFQAAVLEPPYNGFTPDLRFGAFKTSEPALTPDCRKSKDLYLRDNETGELRCLDPEVAGGPESECLVYAGASEDGSRAFLAGRPEGGERYTYSLYESTAASGPQLVSVLPNGEPAPASKGTSFGPGGNSFKGEENCQFTRRLLRHAISADGSRAFWTFVPEEGKHEPNQLLVRIDGKETLQLDALPPKAQGGGPGPAGNGVFWAASADGSVAYFTDAGRLLKGSHAEPGAPDLYRYQLGEEPPLTDLTKGEVPGGVEGVLGTSDDGSHVYFVATAALSGEEENEAGQRAKEGAHNLYLYHEGKTSFIAALAGEDRGDWESEPRELSSRVSPDGRHLALLSVEAEALAGYENTIAAGEHCGYGLSIESNTEFAGGPRCRQAFLYDAQTGKLTCASCNPAGSRPLGPTVLPGWSNGFEGPRYLSDDGSRLFFESFDALSPADENEKLDIYEFESAGSGSCNEENPAFDPLSGGCQFLLSSGTSSDESFLIDASADGRDVFFSTRSSLTGWDVNENFDIYDARAGGGLPEPSRQPTCLGEACKPPTGSPPGTSSAVTPHFEGPGNPVRPKQPRKPRKHKHAHKHKAKKKQAKANNQRRTRR